MSKNTRRPYALVFVASTLLIGAATGAIFGERSIPENEQELVLRASQIVTTLLEWLPEEHEPEDIVYDGIGGMLQVLDPHSNYLDPRSFRHMRARQEGSFFGVGIIISRRNGKVTVISPIAGTPAASRGLRAGDVIAGVAGEDTEDLNLDEVVDLVRGPEGTTVVLTIARPGFKEPFDVEIERTRMLTGLKLELSQPEAVAGRRFIEGIYGGHPYGNQMTEASLQSISRVDMVEFHGKNYRPGNALFVVAGDVDRDDIVRRLEKHFGDWKPAAGHDITMSAPPSRAERTIHLYHKPGSVQAVVRIGHLMKPATDPDWVALDVGLRVLGGGSTAWLFQVLRQEKGYTYGAYANTAKRVDLGYFQAGAEVRNEVADSSLADMLALIERLRSEPVPEADLKLAKDYLTGSFPRQIETPQQVAGAFATARLRGLPDDYLEKYRGRVAVVDAAAVQQVASQHIRPDEALVVVVGDATQIYDKVAPFGTVVLFDVEGNPISLADLEVTAAAFTFDATAIQPATLVYSLVFQGNPIGEIITQITRESLDGRDVVRSKSAGGAMGMTLEQEVVFEAAAFSGIESFASQKAGAQGVEIDLRLEGGVVAGTVSGMSEEPREVSAEVVEGTLLPGMDDYLVWLADYEANPEIEMPAFSAQSGNTYMLKVKVVAETTVTVPAGEFKAYQLEVSGDEGSATLYARKQAPHIVLKQEPAGQPVVIELKEIR